MEKKQIRTKRQSNFELLRIIAMFFIVIHHSLVHGILTSSYSTILTKSDPLSVSLFNSFAFLGKVGVYLFVLITGYFMINSNISLKKVIKLWFPVFFWSVSLTLICGTILKQISIVNIIKSCLPIFFNQYWFITVYVIMYLFIPFMNKFITQLDIKQELFFVMLALIIIFPGHHFYGVALVDWFDKFCIAYCFGALIRKHDLLTQHRFISLGKCLLLLGFSVAILFSFVFSYLAFKFDKISFIKYSELSDQGLNIFCFFAALGLFIWIGSKTLNYNHVINTIASTTFGIYLIHDNTYVRPLLWLKTLHMNNLLSQPAYTIFYVLLVCVLIFSICSLMEYIRKRLFGHFENRLCNWANKYFTNLINLLSTKMADCKK